MIDGAISINCDGIACKNKIDLPLPKGWHGSFEGEGDGRWLYCDDCQLEGEWFGEQCPGCVESYPDCGLSRAFQYSYKRTITEEQLAVIEKGKCPYRINGTFGVYKGEFMNMDLSEIASKKSGIAVADAIRLYINLYPTKE